MRNVILVLLMIAGITALAQQPTPGAASDDDLRAIRLLLEQQSRQLETLTLQVSRLNQLIEARGGPTAAATPITEDMPPVESDVATGAPGRTHVVAKGDTLVSIAKRHDVDVDDLRRINNIQDVRKLQIGQALTIPEPAATATPPAAATTPLPVQTPGGIPGQP